MPEYKLRPGDPTLPNWNCKRCWRSNTLNPYESKDRHLAGIISHIKAKYVVLASPLFAASSVRLTLLPHLRRHDIDQPTDEDYYFGWSDGVPQFVHLDENRS